MAKAELKTKATKASADAFISKIADKQMREDCQAIAKMMRDVTKSPAVMWGPSIVGFGDWSYKYESGREGDWFIMGFSPRKQNLTLYIMPGFDDFADEMAKLGKYKTGKSCLYLKRLEDVDTNVLKKIMTKAAGRLKQMGASSGTAGSKKKTAKKTARKKTAKKMSTRKK